MLHIFTYMKLYTLNWLHVNVQISYNTHVYLFSDTYWELCDYVHNMFCFLYIRVNDNLDYLLVDKSASEILSNIIFVFEKKYVDFVKYIFAKVELFECIYVQLPCTHCAYGGIIILLIFRLQDTRSSVAAVISIV